MSLIFFRIPDNGLNLDNFAKIAHKVEKSKYFLNIENELGSPINFPSSVSSFKSYFWAGGTDSHSYSANACIWLSSNTLLTKSF